MTENRWGSIKKKFSENVVVQVTKLSLLSEEEIEAIQPLYEAHVDAEFDKDVKDRSLFTDQDILIVLQERIKELKEKKEDTKELETLARKMENGVIVAILFPTKADKTATRASDYKQVESNKSWYWWGCKLALTGSIITMFMPEDWDVRTVTKVKNKKTGKLEIKINREGSKFGWASEAAKGWIYIMRGRMTRQFKWIGDAKNSERSEVVFLREARKRFDDEEIKTMDDLSETQWNEVDRIKYTFNPVQLLKRIQ